MIYTMVLEDAKTRDNHIRADETLWLGGRSCDRLRVLRSPRGLRSYRTTYNHQNMLLVSRQMFQEVAPIFYSLVTFGFVNTSLMLRFLTEIGSCVRFVAKIKVMACYKKSTAKAFGKLADAAALRQFSLPSLGLVGSLRLGRPTNNHPPQIFMDLKKLLVVMLERGCDREQVFRRLDFWEVDRHRCHSCSRSWTRKHLCTCVREKASIMQGLKDQVFAFATSIAP